MRASKLSDDDYRAIYASDESTSELAARYDVALSWIVKIRRRESRAVIRATTGQPARSRRSNWTMWAASRDEGLYGRE